MKVWLSGSGGIKLSGKISAGLTLTSENIGMLLPILPHLLPHSFFKDI